MREMKFDIILEKEEGGGYSVHCPLLKGCHSQGKTRQEAIDNIREAIHLYLEISHEKANKSLVGESQCSVIEITV